MDFLVGFFPTKKKIDMNFIFEAESEMGFLYDTYKLELVVVVIIEVEMFSFFCNRIFWISV